MHCVDIFVYFQLIVKHAQESFPWLGLFCQSISLQALSISIGYLMDLMFLILFNLWGVHYKFFFRFRRLVAHFCGNLYPELRPSWAEHLDRLTVKHRCFYPVISSCLTCLLSRFWHEHFTRPFSWNDDVTSVTLHIIHAKHAVMLWRAEFYKNLHTPRPAQEDSPDFQEDIQPEIGNILLDQSASGPQQA